MSNTSKVVEIDHFREKLIERVEELIQHYQNKADELKIAVEDAKDSDSTINVYKCSVGMAQTAGGRNEGGRWLSITRFMRRGRTSLL